MTFFRLAVEWGFLRGQQKKDIYPHSAASLIFGDILPEYFWRKRGIYTKKNGVCPPFSNTPMVKPKCVHTGAHTHTIILKKTFFQIR